MTRSTPLAETPKAIAARDRLLSEALRPAETTETWAGFRAHRMHVRDASRQALADVGLIVAGNEQEEALAIALAIREALESPGTRTAPRHARPHARPPGRRRIAALGPGRR